MAVLLGCGLFLVIAALVFAGAFLRAWVFTVLWGWFIVPAFGAAPLDFWTGVAIFLGIGLVRVAPYTQLDTTTDPIEKRKRYSHFISQTVFVPLLTLFFGWLIHTFVR